MSEALHSFYVELYEPTPPSVNHLYTSGFKGRRVLSKEGLAFKDALIRTVAEECMAMSWQDAIKAVYEQGAWVRLTIGFHLPLFNKSWKPGGRTEKGELQSPYKKIDGSNYIKAIEDAVSKAIGIDDSANLTTTIHKIHSDVKFVNVACEVFAKEVSHAL